MQALNLFDRFLQNVVRVNFEPQHHGTCFEHHGNTELGVSNLHHFLHQCACSYREGENIKVAINCWNNGVVCVCVPSSHHLQEGHADVEALVQLALPHDPHICYVQQTQVALHHTFC